MRVFDPPGSHLVEQPEAVDAQRDDSEEPPNPIFCLTNRREAW